MGSEQETGDLAKPSALLEQLLKEASTNNVEDNFQKIKELVEKTAAMKKMVPERSKKVDEYFNTLRERIDNSSDYLDKAKKDIEKIKYTFQKDKMDNLNSMSYLEFMDKSDEEIELEMESIKLKLDDLDKRVKTLKKNEESTAEESLAIVIQSLTNLSNGVYDDNL